MKSEKQQFKIQNLSKIIFIASALVFLAAGCLGTPRTGKEGKVYQNAEKQLQNTQTAKYEGENGRTALEILKEKYTVQTKEFSGIGEYVISIDGKKEDTGKNFWAFYVNGEQAQVGASSYQTKNGDKIEWKLELIK